MPMARRTSPSPAREPSTATARTKHGGPCAARIPMDGRPKPLRVRRLDARCSSNMPRQERPSRSVSSREKACAHSSSISMSARTSCLRASRCCAHRSGWCTRYCRRTSLCVDSPSSMTAPTEMAATQSHVRTCSSRTAASRQATTASPSRVDATRTDVSGTFLLRTSSCATAPWPMVMAVW